MHYDDMPVHLLVSRSSVAQAGGKTQLDTDFKQSNGLKGQARVRLCF